MKLFWKIVKYIFYTIIFGVCGLVIFRSCIMFDYYPSEMKEILWTDSAKRVYENDPKNFKAYTWDLSYIYDDSQEGNFFASSQVILPTVEQFQITLRFNDSTLKKYSEKYSKNIEDIEFEYYLSDNNGKHYPLTTMITDRAFNLYNYVRLVFDGVDTTSVTHLYLDIYFKGEADLESRPVTSLLLFEQDNALKKFRINKP
jgi:hypothetical protein